MSSWRRTFVAGVCVSLLATALSLSSIGQWLDSNVFLDWVYEIRGTRTPPDDVLVVSMDQRDADLPVVTRSDRIWSRHLYASLIDRLVAANVSVIVFDVTFEGPTDEAADRSLEESIARSNRVVLFKRLTRTESRNIPIKPLKRFASVAKAEAVFPLPKVSRVDSYWPFFTTHTIQADKLEYDELPSLPIAALQLRLLNDISAIRFKQFIGDEQQRVEALARIETSLDEEKPVLTTSMRKTIIQKQNIEAFVDFLTIKHSVENAQTKSMVRSLLHAYKQRGLMPINFYGPSRTIRTLDHTEVINNADDIDHRASPDLTGTVVFIGHSAKNPVDQLDGIPTVYTLNGLDVSGVEIAATAYANLLDSSRPRLLSAFHTLLIFVLLSLASITVAIEFKFWQVTILSIILGFVYFAFTVATFSRSYILLPISIPLILLVLFTIFIALYLRYFRASRRAQSYHYGLQQLLPSRVVTDIESGVVEKTVSKRLYGTCMITDIKDFTFYAELLGHDHISYLSEEYFSLMMGHVYRSRGELVDVDGDSMTVFWGGADLNEDATPQILPAVVQMAREAENFNKLHPDTPFVTRFGLDRGWLNTSYYGGGGNYRYSIVGDIANTSSRLEGLNKRLGTSVLASRAVVLHSDSVLIRPVGAFLLKGKNTVLDVVEIIGLRSSALPSDHLLCERFSEALALIRNGSFEVAKSVLVDLLQTFVADGPTQFYLELLNDRGSHDECIDSFGVVTIEGK